MQPPIHPVDQMLPARAMVSLGFQHMLVSYLGAIAVPMIVAGALKMTPAQTTLLISTALFTSGIATLLQTVGFWKFGVRLPLMQGVAFGSVGPVIAIGSDPALGFNGVCGAVIGAGILTLFLAPVIGRLKRFFPPVVSGCIITAVGLSLFPVAYQWTGGGHGAKEFGSPMFFVVAFGTVALILFVNSHGGKLVRSLAVLIGLLVGGVAAWLLGMGNFDEVARAPWFTLVTPFAFGLPTFNAGAIATMVIVMVVQMVESMGLFVAIGDIVKRPVTEREATNGLRANGLASAIGGMFAAFPFIAFMENVGLVIVTGVRSLVDPLGRARRSHAGDVRRGGRGGHPHARPGGLRAQAGQPQRGGHHAGLRVDAGDHAVPARQAAGRAAAVRPQQRDHCLRGVGLPQPAAQRHPGARRGAGAGRRARAHPGDVSHDPSPLPFPARQPAGARRGGRDDRPGRRRGTRGRRRHPHP
jgi:uracil-xanthine permease